METAQLGFKKPLSKDEKIEKKKQRLAAIGNSCSVVLYICMRFHTFLDLIYSAFCFQIARGETISPSFGICIKATIVRYAYHM